MAQVESIRNCQPPSRGLIRPPNDLQLHPLTVSAGLLPFVLSMIEAIVTPQRTCVIPKPLSATRNAMGTMLVYGNNDEDIGEPNEQG
jgi:hypothetical protein